MFHSVHMLHVVWSTSADSHGFPSGYSVTRSVLQDLYRSLVPALVQIYGCGTHGKLSHVGFQFHGQPKLSHPGGHPGCNFSMLPLMLTSWHVMSCLFPDMWCHLPLGFWDAFLFWHTILISLSQICIAVFIFFRGNVGSNHWLFFNCGIVGILQRVWLAF